MGSYLIIAVVVLIALAAVYYWRVSGRGRRAGEPRRALAADKVEEWMWQPPPPRRAPPKNVVAPSASPTAATPAVLPTTAEQTAPPVEPAPAPPGALKVILQADLAGVLGSFATRWEREALYRLAVELSDTRSGATASYELAHGRLIFWRGGAGLTMHDAGYRLPDEDFMPIQAKLVEVLHTIDAAGWAVADVFEWAQREMQPSHFGIRVRFADLPYDESPRPGPYQLVVQSMGLEPRP